MRETKKGSIRIEPFGHLYFARTLAFPLQLGCSGCMYDFINPASPQTPEQTMQAMMSCYTVATKGITVATATDEQHDVANEEWMSCMAQRGYMVVKR
ncbi:MAG TPA: hypothetical protein VJV79_26910 [Polyangiaceae bacterium]|nr:hypothetical protein [Polyangiaceae bacterium]